MIAGFMINSEIHAVIGARMRAQRLNQNITIDDLAKHSGVNAKTIASLETGSDVRFSTIIKCLRSLGMLDSLNAAFPDSLPTQAAFTARSPLEVRVRASKKKT